MVHVLLYTYIAPLKLIPLLIQEKVEGRSPNELTHYIKSMTRLRFQTFLLKWTRHKALAPSVYGLTHYLVCIL